MFLNKFCIFSLRGKGQSCIFITCCLRPALYNKIGILKNEMASFADPGLAASVSCLGWTGLWLLLWSKNWNGLEKNTNLDGFWNQGIFFQVLVKWIWPDFLLFLGAASHHAEFTLVTAPGCLPSHSYSSPAERKKYFYCW